MWDLHCIYMDRKPDVEKGPITPALPQAVVPPSRPALPRQALGPWDAPLPGLCSRSLKTSTYRPREKSLSRQARGGRVECDASASRHCRLTNSPARTNMLLLIRRSVRLAAAALGKGRVLAHLGWVGELMAFLNIPHRFYRQHHGSNMPKPFLKSA
jgi:hypothetical protein